MERKETQEGTYESRYAAGAKLGGKKRGGIQPEKKDLSFKKKKLYDRPRWSERMRKGKPGNANRARAKDKQLGPHTDSLKGGAGTTRTKH